MLQRLAVMLSVKDVMHHIFASSRNIQGHYLGLRSAILCLISAVELHGNCVRRCTLAPRSISVHGPSC